MRKGDGIKQHVCILQIPHIGKISPQRQQCGDSQREGECRVGGGGQRVVGIGIERDFAWADGNMMQCADDVLLSCTLKTCMVL